VPPEVFARKYWATGPLHSAAGSLPRDFADLFSPAAADELLTDRALRTPFIRMAKEGKVLSGDCFTASGGFGAAVADQVDPAMVLREFAAGATIVLQGLHRTWPALQTFTRRLVAELGHPAQVNAYITPEANRGFDPHYDVHDVFVLQVSGEKHWRIHAPVRTHPRADEPWSQYRAAVTARAREEPVLDVVMRPGDALYLPRGWLHAATALGERSLHLTLGVRALTRYALVEALLAAAAGEPGLRAGLPLGLDPTDEEQLAGPLAETARLLGHLLARPDVAQVARRLRGTAWPAARPGPIRPLAQAAAVEALDADTMVALRPGLRWRLGRAPDGRVRLELTDRTIDLPPACHPALRALLRAAPVRVGDLPGLPDEDRLVLVRRLLREAVAVPVSA
jgi:hypothetical protein